jgi:hypothetical protein
MASNAPPSFAKDIAPMFTAMDVDHMKMAFDLSNRDSVWQHAEPIYTSVSHGTMPPPSSGEPRWTEAMCARLRAWIDAGGPA